MLLLSLLFTALAVAAPTSSPLVVHEKRSASRRDLAGSRRVNANAILPIRIALTQSNLHEGYGYLMEVSDPTSENYGKHWTTEEIHAKFAPAEETLEAVKLWLEHAGIGREDIMESASRGWIGLDISAATAERLFVTEYYENVDADDNVEVGCDRYHVPSHLSSHIDYVTPGTGVSSFQKRSVHTRGIGHSNMLVRRTVVNGTYYGCGDFMTPACLKALYHIPDAHLNQPENALGIFEIGSVYDQTDLDLFFENFAPYVPQGTHPKLVSINGATAPTSIKNSDGESLLDLDLAYSLVYPESVILYQALPTKKEIKTWSTEVPGNATNKEAYINAKDLWYTLLDAVDGAFCMPADRAAEADCGTAELTRVLSTSYGFSELFQPEALLARGCHEFMKLGLKGHTLVYSSGDYGPAGTEGCIDPANPQIIYDEGPVFNPQFPAVCPYITAVGATQLVHGQSVLDPEQALNQPDLSHSPTARFGSGGGFSNYFPLPSYQKHAVDTYLADYNPGYPTYVYEGYSSLYAGGGLYARGGRGVPDVSTNGAYIPVYVHGANPITTGTTFGTSASAPIFASLITLINQERTAAGKGPVGFINPVLYAHPEVFTDITLGSVPGCGTAGWSITPGWDPVAGLGTPCYPKLLEVFMSLP